MEQRPSNEQHGIEPGPPQLIPILLTLEAQLHEGGWDQPAEAYALHTHGDNLVAAVPLTSRGEDAGIGHPADFMDAVTQQLRTTDALASPQTGRSGFFGLIVAHEAWTRGAAAVAPHDPTKPLADQVGSVECRMALLSTVGGTELLLQRIRGQEPALLPPGQLVGRIPDSMHALTAAIREFDERFSNGTP